jgi:hypothetical protein
VNPREAYLALSDALDTAQALGHAEARHAFALGRAVGHAEGYAQAFRDLAWGERIGHDLGRAPNHEELQARRWGPGGRAAFGKPRDGDYPGREW